jgi:hypothetical protein
MHLVEVLEGRSHLRHHGSRVGAPASGLAVLRQLAASSTPMGVTRIARDLELN